MRDAQRTLDQLVAFAGNKISQEDVRRVLGLVEGGLYVRLARAAVEEDAPTALGLVRGVIDSGKDLEQFYRGLLETYRHMAVARAYPSKIAELLPLPEDESAQLSELAEKADDALLLSSLRLLLEQEWALRHSAVPSIVVETVVIELCRLKSLVSVFGAPEAAVSALGSPSVRPAPPRPVSPPRPELPPRQASEGSEPGEPALAVSEIEEPAVTDVDPNMAAIKSQWREILEKCGTLKKTLQAILADCRPQSYDRGTLVLSCKSAFHQEQLQKPEHKRLIEQSIEQTVNLKVNLVPVMSEAAAVVSKTGGGAPKPQARPVVDVQALRKEEPLVKAVMDIFDGKVVDVIRPNRANP
jgi:DNA polymerase-3 subunit gamma/tau